MATHSADELRAAARVIGQSAREVGISDPQPGRALTGEHGRVERAA
jgi:hypothetical protein